MRSHEYRSVIASAKIFVASVCVLFAVFMLWNTWRARQEQLQEANSTTENISRALVQHADDTIKEADAVLIGIAERLQYDGKSPAALARLKRFLAQEVLELSQLNSLAIIDKDGNWIVNSEQLTFPRLTSRDREYFFYHLAHPDSLPHIGPPVKNRATGDWIVTISRRVNAPDGSFDGLIMAAIKLDYFSTFYNSFDIGKTGALLLALDNGTMLVRRPLRTDSIGKNLKDAAIFRDYASKTSYGFARIRSSQDGVTRLNSYRHLNRYPLFIAVALAEDEVLVQWKTDALLHLFGLLTLTALLGFFGNRLITQITLRVDAEQDAIESRAHIEHLNQALQDLAMQDGLTGLANRRCFDDAISKELRRAARNQTSLSLIMIDVDYFKRYNDTYGHLAGDECLRKIAAAVKAAKKRPDDMVARYGGEEIVVMLPACDAPGAVQIANEMLSAIQALAIVHTGNPPGVVTASAGVGVLAAVSNDTLAEHIIDMADKALYQAKSSGRNRACLFGQA